MRIQQQKYSEEGKPLFLLPQPSKEVISQVSRPVKTTEVSDSPVMIAEKVPMVGMDGIQMTYEVTTMELMGDGTFQQVGTGQFLPIFTTQEAQEKDEDDNPLYWNTVLEDVTSYEAQAPKEITEDDPDYIEGLEPVYEWVDLPDPPAPPIILTPDQQKIASLQDENKILRDQLTATSSDLQAFMDYYFSL
jgi:hypothetical protein